MKNILRQFVYYDEGLVKDFLSSLEGGSYAEVTEQRETSEKSNIEGKLTRTEVTMAQTRASEFSRLHKRLLEAEMLTSLDSIQDADWKSFEKGEIVELQVNLSRSGLNKLAEIVAGFKELAPMMGDSIPGDIQQVYDGMATLTKLSGNKTTFTGTVSTDTSYGIITTLNNNMLLLPREIEGEVTILAKLNRKVQAGEKEAAVDIPRALARTMDFEDLDKKLGSADPSQQNLQLGPVMVNGPAFILTPIAIYR